MKRMLQPGGAALLLILLIGLSACGRDELSFAVTADDILGEYRVNQVAAEAKYLDTSGKVAGRVGSLEPRDSFKERSKSPMIWASFGRIPIAVCLGR